MREFIYSPLVGEPGEEPSVRARLLLFALWAALVAWFLSTHTFWRDEVRAFSFALSGSSVREMLANAQGDGHPALWFLLLRGLHDIFPYREVLPIAGAVTGIAAMAVMTFLSPFRALIIGLLLFSSFGAFDYVVVARNYGIAALIMFGIAAFYSRVKDNLWFGVLLALLANTNVPSCLLASCFLLFRFVELVRDPLAGKRAWTIFFGNAALAAVGAWLCFIMVYPTFNGAAVSKNYETAGVLHLWRALIDTKWSFHEIGEPIAQPLIVLSFLSFVRRPAAFVASIVAFVTLKLFFYTVYNSFYRHEALYIVFLLSMHWMVADGSGGRWFEKARLRFAEMLGRWAFVYLLALQSILLLWPLRSQVLGIPYSRSADVAKILQRPEYRGSVVISDNDPMLEPLHYYVDNPTWFLREQRFGKYVRATLYSRSELTLNDVLADADRLYRATNRPVVYLSNINLEKVRRRHNITFFHNAMIYTPQSIARFRASTRHIAELRGSGIGEHYDVYVYPR